ncbi:MAG: beta-ketoacyl-[acyl-carrier-protein] synthase family protein [Thermoanaerobaculum sp.]|nr:beta-ketoacyl-[acyl-carrier-protein] synthase family protein [Thermoanaerobaculum sp.]
MERVVITGVGLVTALGPDQATTWRRLLAGETGIRPLSLFPTEGYRARTAAQVEDGSLKLPPVAPQTLRHASRASRFALAAASEALAQAGLNPTPSVPWAVVFGGGAAGLFEAEPFVARRLRLGPKVRGVAEFVEVPQDAPTDRVAAAWGLCGERITVTTACSSSTIAIGLGAELIRQGRAEVVLAGGTDALCQLTFAGFNSLRAVDPERARPFDRRRQGLSIGEGAAVVVLEQARGAARRGARPLAEVLGLGVTNDAYHMTQPEPSGASWARTVRAALEDARVDPQDVGYINAHGTATEQNDPAECAAYQQVFGQRLTHIPISSVKGAVGHCLCAAGGIEAAITVLALVHQILPPTVGLEELDEACPIDAIPGQPRSKAVEVALSSSFAFGGNSAVLVLGRAS